MPYFFHLSSYFCSCSFNCPIMSKNYFFYFFMKYLLNIKYVIGVLYFVDIVNLRFRMITYYQQD